jgi:hypothetical protein
MAVVALPLGHNMHELLKKITCRYNVSKKEDEENFIVDFIKKKILLVLSLTHSLTQYVSLLQSPVIHDRVRNSRVITQEIKVRFG